MPNWFSTHGSLPSCGQSPWSFHMESLGEDLYAVTYKGDLSLETRESLRERILKINRGEEGHELGGQALGRNQ